eukprot:Phypoly_transcript_07706.p1 GENE.Phypoly_transcript_07706~~Phypoly_transcript_07706.p1  ORF type:complete len:527 (+),score=70.04 Phypoly_transcript_07706:175-1581(+)
MDESLAKMVFRYATRYTYELPVKLCEEGYYQGTLYGYTLANYESFIARAFLATREKHETFPNAEDEEMRDLLVQVNLLDEKRNSIFNKYQSRRLLSYFFYTPTSQVYSRLLSYNTLDNDFPYIDDVHNAPPSFFEPRQLYPLELALFNVVDPGASPIQNPINSVEDFLANMQTNFRMDLWEKVIDWENFVMVGGSVLKSILKESFDSVTPQDVDFFTVSKGESPDFTYDYFVAQHREFAAHFKKLYGEENVIKTKKYEYVRTVEVKFPQLDDLPPKTIVFQFIWYATKIKKQEVIQIFDLDCCQVGYDGKRVFCTYSFTQSIATRTMINYKLVNDYYDLCTFLPRTLKYQKRGFTLLAPKNFDVNLLKKDYEPQNQTTASTDVKYGFLLNNDTLNVREQFVHIVDPNAPHISSYTPLPPLPDYKNDGFGSDTEAKDFIFPHQAEEYANYSAEELAELEKETSRRFKLD